MHMKLFGSSSNRNKEAAGRHLEQRELTSLRDAEFRERIYSGEAARSTDGGETCAAANAADSPEQAEQAIAEHKGKKRWGCLTAILIVVGVLLAAFAAYKIWLVRAPAVNPEGPNNPNQPVATQPTAAVPETNPPEVTPGVTPPPESSANPQPTASPEPTAATLRREGTYTVLVVAKDQESGNTDTMMVGMLDTEKGELNVVSIPRDTLVNRGWDTPKINAALSYTGSVDGMLDNVSDLLGFRPDNYAVVNISAFVQIVDAIGGVTYDVPYNMDYDDPFQNLSIHFSKGVQWLSGSDAIKVVRWRQNNDGTNYGDIARIENQQKFLSTVARQVISLKNIPNIGTIINICTENLDTSLTGNNLMWYAERLLELNADDIHFYTVPGNYNDFYRSPQGNLSVVTIHVEEWLTMINESFNPFNQEITESNLNVATKDANGRVYATTGTLSLR